MKEHPILFSGPMVQAILEGRKTQTRRVIKNVTREHPEGEDAPIDCIKDWDGLPSRLDWAPVNWEICPYGQPGHRLWVRETFRPWWDEELGCCIQYKDAQVYKPGTSPITPDISDENTGYRFACMCDEADYQSRWKPSIHMPRWASRINLEIVGVHCQRLRDIDAYDALAEGVDCEAVKHVDEAGVSLGEGDIHVSRRAFHALWDSINDKRGYGWTVNPWVWAVTFQRMT